MGIDKIKLGPRSRVLEKQEKEEQEALLDAMTPAHPPLPGPANPQSLRGCGCGKFHIPVGTPEVGIEIDGAVHRYSKPCYTQFGEEERVYYKVKAKTPSVEDRLAALEKVVADLVKERDDQAAQDGEDIRADLAFDAAREDRIFGRHR